MIYDWTISEGVTIGESTGVLLVLLLQEIDHYSGAFFFIVILLILLDVCIYNVIRVLS
jgi:hypothetical protein